MTDNYTMIGAHNYCRNPGGGPPWCFADNYDVVWETCDIRLCDKGDLFAFPQEWGAGTEKGGK